MKGFRPLPRGQMAMESLRELGNTPALIYLLDKSERCIVVYDLEGGP